MDAALRRGLVLCLLLAWPAVSAGAAGAPGDGVRAGAPGDGGGASGAAGFPQRFSASYTLTEVGETDVEVHVTLSLAVSHDDPETVLDVRVRVERPGAPEDTEDPDWTLAAFDAQDIHARTAIVMSRRVILRPDEYGAWTSGAAPRFHLSFYASGEFYQVLLDAVQTAAEPPVSSF